MRSQGRLALGAVGALAVVAAVVPTAAPAAAATSLDARMRASAAFPRVHGLAGELLHQSMETSRW